MEMSKNYKPKEFEKKIYENWLGREYFTAKVDKNKKPFTIVIPPPNITGQLHMGHALNNTLQDIIIRFKRMQGFATLWLPGTDHASIATEVKIVEKMKSEGITKEDIGREGFLVKAWEWKKQYGGRIVEQLKCLGSSCDWSREAFTMDDKCSKAVKKVFVNLYDKGLIYQGNRIINWCPSCKTALSDAEVEYEEKDSFLWHIRYPLADGSGHIIIATTRPETLLGDTAVAVNPDDERYIALIGKNLILPLVNKEIPIVADNYVEKDFGSGAVKITPAHDPNDFELGIRHNLEVIRIMNDDGTMNSLAGENYCGLDRVVAREKVVEDLNNQGFLVKIEHYKHNVGECYRCKSVVEPIVSKQWFVDMKPLAEPAIKVVEDGNIEFIPPRFAKTYFNWMNNIKDWCISRQLWWGHRIPAYYCQDCGAVMVKNEQVSVCEKCASKNIKQDEDVLDTWFSSALWPFSTLGYPDNTEDLKYFYPTNILVTAYDIIFFWVARMIFSGLEHTGEIPFSKVLMHGIVRDKFGKKMSKSAGNGVDPLELIDAYGADSLRFMLVNGVAPGGDIRFSDEKIGNSRNFINKVWNASRFVNMYIDGAEKVAISPNKMSPADKWIMNKLDSTINQVTDSLDRLDTGMAGSILYDFVWGDFCDWYIELSKPALYGDDLDKKNHTIAMLMYVLENSIKMLHPFIPFVTEEIYQAFYGKENSIMIADWAKTSGYNFDIDAKEFNALMEIIKNIRALRLEMNVIPSKKINVYLQPIAEKEIIENYIPYLQKMASIGNVIIVENDYTDKSIEDNASIILSEIAKIIIPLGDLVDKEKELRRLNEELSNVLAEIARAEKMLNNAGFVAKAPATLIDTEKEKLEKFKLLASKIKEQIEVL